MSGLEMGASHQEHAEQMMQPQMHSFEQLIEKGLSPDYARDVIDRDKSIIDVWDEAQEGLKGQ